jgi:hypothetical protein
MRIRNVLAACLLAWGSTALGQTTGRFYLEKTVYSVGEPVFVYFQVVNIGSKTEAFYSSDQYYIWSGYQFSVSSDRPGPPCGAFAVSGGGGFKELQPGEKRIERILLNFAHKIDVPADYSVEAVRRVPFRWAGTKDTLEVHSTLHFVVVPRALKADAFEPWVDQLRSNDVLKRMEAARTLASVAPLSLEKTLLAFAGQPDIQQFAPLAFHRLNTPQSMAAMTDLLKTTPPGSWEHFKAEVYLADEECGDDF